MSPVTVNVDPYIKELTVPPLNWYAPLKALIDTVPPLTVMLPKVVKVPDVPLTVPPLTVKLLIVSSLLPKFNVPLSTVTSEVLAISLSFSKFTVAPTIIISPEKPGDTVSSISLLFVSCQVSAKPSKFNVPDPVNLIALLVPPVICILLNVSANVFTVAPVCSVSVCELGTLNEAVTLSAITILGK